MAGNLEALDSLIIALHDGDHRVQHRAVRALGALGDSRSIPPLPYLRSLTDGGLQAVIGEAHREIVAERVEGR